MHTFQPVNPEDIESGAYQFNGKSMLITAAKGDKVNSMTAAWGGVGYLWDRRVVFIFVRESRYTREFLDESGEFSLNFMNPEKYRGAFKYLGTVSGRDEDKIANARLTVDYDDGIPYFDEARNVITCKVLYQQKYEKECFVDKGLVDKYYGDNDYHIVYVAEIKNVLVR